MQVRARCLAGGADPADERAGRNFRSDLDFDLAEVGVEGGVTVSVLDRNQVAVTRMLSCKHDSTGQYRAYVAVFGRGEVDPLVKTAELTNRVDALSELTREPRRYQRIDDRKSLRRLRSRRGTPVESE